MLLDDSARKRTLRISAKLLQPSPKGDTGPRPTENLAPRPAIAVPKQTKAKVILQPHILALTDAELSKLIADKHMKKYKNEAKELQLETVVALVRGLDTFVLASTGYGKTRIAEMYLDLFPRELKAISIVINPLDALGDNQVRLVKLAFKRKTDITACM